MLRAISIISASIFLFGGCQTYNAFDMLKKDKLYEKALQETKNGQIITSLETKAKISATYLNGLYPSTYKDKEYFFVGVFIPDDFDKPELFGLNNKNFDFGMLKIVKKEAKLGEAATIQKVFVKPDSIEHIKKPDENSLYKSIPHTDAWSRYYVVSFSKQEGVGDMTLVLKSESGEATLNFSKAR